MIIMIIIIKLALYSDNSYHYNNIINRILLKFYNEHKAFKENIILSNGGFAGAARFYM